MAKESVLSIAEKEAIVIEKLIFHIIIANDLYPKYLDEIEITDEQKKFFKERLSEAAQGRQYIFNSTDGEPAIKKWCEEIVTANNERFLEISKEITESFHKNHNGNTNDGVFVISIASINKRKLVFLIKIDHKKVYKYKLVGEKEKKALLEEVKNTFIEDKSAIQKVALIDTDLKTAWDILVFDRSKAGGITEYFAKFLSVIPRETESDLTKKFQSLSRKWASSNRSVIDPNQEPSDYKERARNYLMNTDIVKSDDYIDAVIQDDSEDRRKQLKESFRSFLVEEGMYGQEFCPNKNALTPKERKNIRQTAEGVKIEWTGEMKDNNIKIPNKPDQNGEYIIQITTSQLTDIQ